MNRFAAYGGARLADPSKWVPFYLGFLITISYLLLRCALDCIFLFTIGFPFDYQPLWLDINWWTEIVNAILIGYIPASLVVARRGINRDLEQLKSRLRQKDTSFEAIFALKNRPAQSMGQAFRLAGLLGGFFLVFTDSTSYLGTERALTNPGFVWSLIRLPLFVWLICTLIVSDLNATRTYWKLGRHQVDVDLLDIQSLQSFTSRGLRSALTWILFSIIFSLFWLGDSASEQNVLLLIVMLTMATAAFALPLIGVHQEIKSVKVTELDRLRNEIRTERSVVIDQPSTENISNPRLANLISYYHFIEQVREWPIDAANLLRFFLYLIIGLGSWLGGAVVERMLDSTLGS